MGIAFPDTMTTARIPVRIRLGAIDLGGGEIGQGNARITYKTAGRGRPVKVYRTSLQKKPLKKNGYSRIIRMAGYNKKNV